MNPDEPPLRLEHPPHPVADAEEWIGAKRMEISELAGGCLMMSGSSLITFVLLVLNGALVMAILTTLSAAGVQLLQNEGAKEKATQFVLFAGPIVLTVLQWKMIDTLRWIFRRRRRGV